MIYKGLDVKGSSLHDQDYVRLKNMKFLSLLFFLSFFTFNSSAQDSGDDSRVTWDLGASAGSYEGVSYSEVNLGVNYFFVDWVNWRHSLYYRLVNSEESDNQYGLDTLLRLHYQLKLGRKDHLTLFGGPGFRWSNEGPNPPTLEGGADFRLAGLSLGAGVKVLYNSYVDKDAKDDTQFFVRLAGSGEL